MLSNSLHQRTNKESNRKMHRLNSRVIFLLTAFLIGLGLVINAMTQHDASTAERVFAQMNPNVDPNIAKLPMHTA
jgi:hypothetical protein